MSSLANQSMIRDSNAYTIVWERKKKRGCTSTQKVTVYGIDAVQCVIDNIVPNDTKWDVFCGQNV
jgi:hypothetical protein